MPWRVHLCRERLTTIEGSQGGQCGIRLLPQQGSDHSHESQGVVPRLRHVVPSYLREAAHVHGQTRWRCPRVDRCSPTPEPAGLYVATLTSPAVGSGLEGFSDLEALALMIKPVWPIIFCSGRTMSPLTIQLRSRISLTESTDRL